MSKCLVTSVSDVVIQDSGANLSDHIPVIVKFNMRMNVGTNAGLTGKKNKVLRWDKANLANYYESTCCNLYSVYCELCLYKDMHDVLDFHVIIDKLYTKIVDALLRSDKVIPRASPSHFKHWWNSSLDALKFKSIECCKLWIAGGKPNEGEIFQNMRQAKLDYKRAIMVCRDENELKFSENLYDNLLDKDLNNFWKTWRSKLGKKSTPAKCVEGSNSNGDIAQTFKDFFSRTCIPNNAAVHQAHKEEFLRDFSKYNIYEDTDNMFSLEDIEQALSRLKKGKASGIDNISAEHLLYAHPCLVVSLKILFNLMLAHGFVPDDFGSGLLIPILKDSNADAACCDNYRGITLSCVISKVFEYALLSKYCSLFNTDDLQFGFRNGVGCSDALYTVKSVVDHC